jgi:hypothetical protein
MNAKKAAGTKYGKTKPVRQRSSSGEQDDPGIIDLMTVSKIKEDMVSGLLGLPLPSVQGFSIENACR